MTSFIASSAYGRGDHNRRERENSDRRDGDLRARNDESSLHDVAAAGHVDAQEEAVGGERRDLAPVQ